LESSGQRTLAVLSGNISDMLNKVVRENSRWLQTEERVRHKSNNATAPGEAEKGEGRAAGTSVEGGHGLTEVQGLLHQLQEVTRW